MEVMPNMFFKSLGHKDRFLASMLAIGKVYDGRLDQEYGAALYILTADHAIWQKAQPYVTHEGIDIEAMLAEIDLSGGYGVLVQLAGNLFNSEQHIDPVELMRLDDSNFKVALVALQVRRASIPMSELSEEF
jgi:hypothetical protein